MRKLTLEERLLKHREIDSQGCWLWTGSTSGKGYGKLTHEERTLDAHRASAIQYLGLNPDASHRIQVLHKPECQNKLCFNPEHLYIGTFSDNLRDSYGHEGRTPPNRWKHR